MMFFKENNTFFIWDALHNLLGLKDNLMAMLP